MKRATLLVALLALLASAMIARRVSDAALDGVAPRWWKGNTHTHTLWSDGDAAPEQVASWYQDNGYDFLVFTDHNLLLEGEMWVPVSDEGPLERDHVDALEDTFGADWVVTRAGQEGSLEMRLKTFDEVVKKLARSGSPFINKGVESLGGYHLTTPPPLLVVVRLTVSRQRRRHVQPPRDSPIHRPASS